MTSINPSFGNNFNNGINYNLNKSGAQSNSANAQPQFNVGSLNNSSGDSFTFSGANKTNKEPENPPTVQAARGWRPFLRAALNIAFDRFIPFGLPGVGDMLLGDDNGSMFDPNSNYGMGTSA